MMFKRKWRALGLALTGSVALWLTYGATRTDPANPALWRVDGPAGQSAYLFGTIHALPRAAAWRTPKVAAALDASDRIVVEIAAVNDDAATARAFQSLAHTPHQPPITDRVPADLRPKLAQAIALSGHRPADFADIETWAAALLLAQGSAGDNDPRNGVDRALINGAHPKPVIELEGAQAQLSIFDRLPEPAQRALLASVISGGDEDANALALAWRTGNIAAIARETHAGMLADPALREALYVARNRAWTGTIAAILGHGGHSFVAVGTAHMAGPDGLPAMLAARGYRVTRVE
jgi:uncharacterized protein YbaP (TraB family)